MANVKAYLQITMNIKESDREKAIKEYFDYRQPFLNTIEGGLNHVCCPKATIVLCAAFKAHIMHDFVSIYRLFAHDFAIKCVSS